MAHKTALRRILDDRGITGCALAAAVGVHENSVYNWTSGRYVPEPATALRVAELLGVDVADLWPQLSNSALLAASANPEHVRDLTSATVTQLPVRTLTADEVLDLPITGHPRWHDQAVCVTGGHPPDTWWPEQSQHGKTARQLCAGCLVIADCAAAFLSDPWPDPSGIVAGVRGYELLAAFAEPEESEEFEVVA
jgi:DNA-binding XRE family transcriptional regulator